MKMRPLSGEQPASQLVRLKLDLIRLDAGTQTRAQIDEATVADYAEAIIRGDRFPPGSWFSRTMANTSWRTASTELKAARRAKHTHILAEIRNGTRTDALRFALGANHKHGLRRSNLDKRHSVEMALTEFGNLSDHLLSEMCGVSQSFVTNVRQQLFSEISSTPRLGKDGKLRALPTRGLNGSHWPAITGHHNWAAQGAGGHVPEITRAFTDIEGFAVKTLEEHPERSASHPGVDQKSPFGFARSGKTPPECQPPRQRSLFPCNSFRSTSSASEPEFNPARWPSWLPGAS